MWKLIEDELFSSAVQNLNIAKYKIGLDPSVKNINDPTLRYKSKKYKSVGNIWV